MAAFVPTDTVAGEYRVTPAGAESNVAIGVSQLGRTARWVSRLGRDRMGDLVREHVRQHGVDVQIEWDDERPTGVCIKEIGDGGTRMRYYRDASAARHLSRSQLRHLDGARWVHVTGISPALSQQCADVVDQVLDRRAGPTTRTSFDVNYRPTLWPDATTAAVTILGLAARADLVFIGEDEAEALVGSTAPADLSQAILRRRDQQVVLKRGPGPASVITMDGSLDEPSLVADVADLTGAGDAFAAGFLAGACHGCDTRHRLRLAHFLASRAVGVFSDTGPMVAEAELVPYLTEAASPSAKRTDKK